MADMLVRSEIELSVPVAERHINSAREAASYLTTDKSSIQKERHRLLVRFAVRRRA